MGKVVRETFLGVRFLISVYLILVAFPLQENIRSAVVVTVALYFSLALLAFLKQEKAKPINLAIDFLFIPPLIYITGDPRNIFALMPLVALHANRHMVPTALLLISGVLLSGLMLAEKPVHLFSTLILLTATPFAAMVPDIIGTIKKERENVKKLKSSYHKLLGDFAKWERERKELESLKFLMEASTESEDVTDFLKKVKERFKVKRIHLLPKKKVSSYTPLMDREKGLLSVPVKLEEGNAVVIFELESPFQLNDELLVASLERAGRMVALFVAGFQDDSSMGRAINVG